MGLGVELGGNRIDDFFYFSSENPYVVSFLLSIVILWTISLYWLLVRDGVETLAKHPGLFNPKNVSARFIKLFALASIVGGVVFLVVVFSGVLSPPVLKH